MKNNYWRPITGQRIETKKGRYHCELWSNEIVLTNLKDGHKLHIPFEVFDDMFTQGKIDFI